MPTGNEIAMSLSPSRAEALAQKLERSQFSAACSSEEFAMICYALRSVVQPEVASRNGDSHAAAGGDLADAIRSLVSEGRFDLRDSPKSLVANIVRILGEYDERVAQLGMNEER